MTPATYYLVFASALFVAAQMALALWELRAARRYRQLAKFERIRCQFGVARQHLVWLAAHDKISSESITFHNLYLLQSRMMRVVDDYPKVSGALWANALTGGLQSDGEMLSESKAWNDDVREVVQETADALHRVWFGCMPFGTTARVGTRLLTRVSVHSGQRVIKHLASAQPGLDQVRQLEQSLRRQIAA